MMSSMRQVAATVTAAFLVACLGQSAMADCDNSSDKTTIKTITTTAPCAATERVIEAPVVLQPAPAPAYRVTESPAVVVRERRDRWHLLYINVLGVHAGIF